MNALVIPDSVIKHPDISNSREKQLAHGLNVWEVTAAGARGSGPLTPTGRRHVHVQPAPSYTV